MPKADSSLNMLIVAAVPGARHRLLRAADVQLAPPRGREDRHGRRAARPSQPSSTTATPKAATHQAGLGRVGAGPRRAVRRRGPHRRAGARPHRRGAGGAQRQGGCRRAPGAPRRRGAGRPRACRDAPRWPSASATATTRPWPAAQDRRTAEDKVANAERQLVIGREELRPVAKARAQRRRHASRRRQGARCRRQGAGAAGSGARSRLRKALSVDDLPAPTRLEAALTAGRAELSLAEAALERTRIRAPSTGTVLQINAKVGETAAPSPENVLVVVGDTASLRVRAELEERDIGKVRVGQTAVVRSDAFPGKDFEGKVSSLAQALGPSRLGQRGPRRPTDIDVLEVIIDLDRPAAAAARHARRRVPAA